MAKKLTRKEKIALQQQPGTQSTPGKKSPSHKKKFRLHRVLGIITAFVAFSLYVNTVHHRYVLDDFGLIKENTDTKKGIKGIPTIFSTSYRSGMNFTDYTTYRPLSKAMFAIEWQLAPNDPELGHWVNVILFSLTCWILFYVLHVFMKGNLLVPFIATLLFAAHPIHTEVIANIKSRDEILCFMLSILTALWCYRHVTTAKKKYLILSAVTFFLALLSKESAITWIIVIPMMIYFFSDAPRSKYTGSFLMILLSTGIFMIIRKSILGNHDTPIPVVDNSLVAIPDFLTQRTTAIYIMGIYLKLFFFPSPLCSDGSFNSFLPAGIGDWRFLVPFVIYSALLVYAIIQFRKKDPISFSILYFFITASIVSNVLVLIGTNYGERLMYIPSLSVCLAVAVLLQQLFKTADISKPIANVKEFFSGSLKPIVVTVVLVCAFSYKTISRNIVWYNDDILFKTDVETVPNSAHMLYYIANHLSAEEILDLLPDSASREKQTLLAIDQLSRCVSIYPKYADAFQRRGYLYYIRKNYVQSEPDFVKSLEINPTNSVTHNNYGNLLFNTQRYAEAMHEFSEAIRYNPKYAHANNNYASVNGVYGMGEKEAAMREPEKSQYHLDESRKYFETAIKYFKIAIDIDDTYSEPFRLLSVTYRNLGDNANADKYAAMGEKVKVIEDRNKKVK